MIGTLLAGRYELTGQLSEGPVFSLFTARDRQQGRDVGLRLVRSPFDHEQRFLDELSRAVSRQTGLVNPSIETLGGVERGDWGAFLYGEVTRGPSLQDRIRKLAPFSVPVSLDLAISLLRGLEALHRNNVVHGDVSPANVVVMPNGSARLQLAGIWEAYHASGEAAKAVYPGMAPYLAPEVSAGEMPSPQSDLYAAGVVLFELLVGRQPYHGESPAAIVRRHEEDEIPDVRAYNSGVPYALAGMVAKAMAKDPRDRYNSAGEMLADLKAQQDALRFGKTLAWPPPEMPQPRTPKPKAVVTPSPAPKRTERKRSAEPEPVAPKMGAIRDEEDEPRRRPKKDRDVPIWMLGIIAFLMAGVLGLVGVWFMFNMNRPKLVKVPNVESLSLSEARELLDPLHLELRVASREPNEKVEPDRILDVNPDAGTTVREGGRIYVVVSGGSRYVQMPDLKGYTPDRARSVLEGLGLQVDSITDEAPSDIPVGNVVAQSPEARAKVERQSSVRLTLSAGPRGATPTAGSKQYIYNLEFPVKGISHPVKVRMEIVDENGTRIVYEDRKEDGDTVNAMVKGYGEKATFRIYYDDELIKEFEQAATS